VQIHRERNPWENKQPLLGESCEQCGGFENEGKLKVEKREREQDDW
jgi:hypothetical protein